MELPQLCNRCGECCRVGGNCMARVFARLPADFQGRCEVLVDNPDGTTSCPQIAIAAKTVGGQIWLACYVDGNCDSPELRKEICATVHA